MAKEPPAMTVKVRLDTVEVDGFVAALEERIREVAAEVADQRVASLLGDMLGNLEGDEFAGLRSAIAPWLVKIGARS